MFLIRLSYFSQRLLALILLVAFFPVLLSLALVVRIYLGSPVLFRQNRPGLYGRTFQLIKFRTK